MGSPIQFSGIHPSIHPSNIHSSSQPASLGSFAHIVNIYFTCFGSTFGLALESSYPEETWSPLLIIYGKEGILVTRTLLGLIQRQNRG